MAGSRSLGTLTLDLILKAGGFTAGLDKAGRDADRKFKQMGDSAERFGRGLGSSLKRAGGALLAFAGVTASVAGAIDAVKSAIDRADAIRDLSIRVGASTEALSGFSYAAKQTGTDIEALSKGMLILSKNAALALNPKSKQAGLFKALLGDDFKKDLGDVEVLLPKLAEKFSQLENGTQKAALAQQLFGRSGAELIEFLNLGEGGLKAMTDRAKELGVVIDQDTADAADRFNDKLADLKAVTGGLAMEVASALLPQLEAIVDWAVGFVQDGGGAESMLGDLRIAFARLTTEIENTEPARNAFVSYMGDVRAELVATESQFKEALVSIVEFFAVYKYQIEGAARLRKNISADFSNVQQGPVTLSTVTVVGNIKEFAKQEAERRKQAKLLQDEINKYMGNPTGKKAGGGGAKKTGKSDAEKEADDIQKAYERLNESLTQQKTLVGDVTELEKLRYELTQGAAAKIDPIKKAELETLAKEVDAIEAANKMKEEAKNLEESLLTPAEQINKERARAKELLDAGAISQDTYNKALQASLTPYEEVLANLREEIELLGMSADAQDKYMARKAAGVAEGTPEGNEVDRMVQLRNETEETTAAFNEFKDVTADLFSDVIQDSSNAGDALEEWGKRVLAIFAKIAAQKIIDKIFEQSASSAGGSGGGGFWANLFSSFASSYSGSGGGGHAAGGITNPGMMYPVNENGTELYTENGKDYLLTGSKGGRVSPVGASARGAGVTQIFQTLGLETRRTRERKAQLAGREAQRAIARNGH